jgi:Flp pilus assembly protein TadG
MLGDFVRRFIRDRRANTAIVFALSIIPIIFLTGMGMDFSSATSKRIMLNAAADSAALSMVTPSAMNETCAQAQSTAQNIFMGQASLISELNYGAPTFSGCQDNVSTRTVTVNYTAYSINAFPNVLGLLTGTPETTWTVSGSSTATATTSPNINFFLLLDNSPSMDIAATTAGINTMVANTSAQGGGCAFACHETDPEGENPSLGNPVVNGQEEDNYALANSLRVVTRIENMASATSSLMSTASQMMTSNNATCPNGPGCYKMAIFTFNVQGTTNSQCSSTSIQAIYAPSCAPSSNLSAAQTAASGIDVLEVCTNNYLTCSDNNNDTDTDFEKAMKTIDNIMPDPGSGTSGSSPQEVLFLVSDGVDDEVATSCSEPFVPGTTRCQQMFDTSWCTTVKNRGIRIAVLYTEYLPLPTNYWYNEYVAPFQSQIGTNMQSCASPGLYFQVTTDGDITAAMQALFQQAVSTARLSQ